MSTSQVYSHRDYTIGWICALRKEQTAATAMLDVIHDDLPNHSNDPNAYTLGSIGKHNIAIACLPEGRYGNNAAATAAAHMVSAFPSLRFGLMVGIGGGIPSNKIRLGDVVVSKPDSCFPGVVQWDLGKIEQGGTVEHIGSLNNPPTTLLTSLAKLGTKREMEGSQIPNLLAAMGEKWPNLVAKYTRSESLRDVLFADDYTHAKGPATDDSVKGTQTCDTETEEGEDEDEDVNDCRFCDFTQARKRKPRATRIHYGLIASGNMVIKDAQFRNQLNERFGNNILCVEMEAAGLMNDFPCLVIRGICDYADSHKNKAWQEYAAAVAAAFAKELLLVVPAHAVEQMDTITSILSDIRYDVGLAVDYLKEAKAFKHDEKDEKILDWISPFDYGAEHSDVLKRWQPGTCQWLLESTEFREFVERSDKRILFCPGIPGAGKTVMAATVIDYLHKQFAHDSSISIAYIYFNFRRHSEQDPSAVFSSLLKQVSQQQPSLNSSITSLYETHVKKRTCPSLKEIIKTLQDVVQMHSRVFVIIDALDECASSDHYREIISSEIIDCTKKSDLKLFATARDIPEISERFKYALRLEIKAVESDIRRYIDSRLSSLSPTSVISKSKTLQDEIKTGISDTVGGMFLLAQLHFDQLTDCITRKAVMKTLKALPTGSNAYDYTYNAAMDRINHQSSSRRQLAIKVLSWITHAVRPLSVAELQHALGVEIGEDEFDENNLPQTEDIVSTSVGLVTIDEESEVIRLVHYTTQDFFERNREKWLPNAKTYIAEVCSCYLSYSVFEDGLHEDNFKMIEKFELFNYAVRFWQHHVSMSDFSQRHVNFLKKTSHLRIFAKISYSRLFTGLHIAAESGWSDIVKVLLEDIADADAHDEFNRTPFYLAASGGHDTVMRTLLNSCQIDVNVISSKSTYTPLINAAQSGHAAAVKLLLNTGKVNAGYTCKKQKSALWYAAVGGHVDVALLLSDPRNYDPGMVREIFSSALLGAVIMKQEPIVHLLLETGYADVNVQTTNESSPFFWGDIPDDRPLDDAIWNDQPINMGGEITDLDDIIWSYLPIHMRRRLEDFSGIFWHYEPIKKRGKLDAFDDITWGYLAIEIRRSLVSVDSNTSGYPPFDMTGRVDHFVDIPRDYLPIGVSWDIQECKRTEYSLNQGKSPLCLAVELNYENIAKILLGREEIKVDLKSKDLYSSTALTLAIRCGRTDIFRLFLYSGRFDINSKDEFGQTPLMIATLQACKEIVDLLLQRNSLAVDLQDKFGRTALFYAVLNNEVDIAELLVNIGRANSHIKDTHSLSPLIVAVTRGREKIVRLLLETPGALNTQDDDVCLLLLAVDSGMGNIVKLCLEVANLDVNARDHSGLTPLLLAAKHPSYTVDIIQLLLDTGNVDFNARDYKYQRTALLWAAYAGYLKSFTTLLQTGKFDINERDVHSFTPLTLAAQKGNAAIVEYLLCIDAVDLHAKDYKHNRTALMWAASNRPLDCFTTLLEMGKFDVNERDVHGLTPFTIATQERQADNIESLLKTNEVDLESLLKTNEVDLYVRDYRYGRTTAVLDLHNGRLSGLSLLLESPKIDTSEMNLGGLDSVAIGFKGHHPKFIVLFEKD